MDPINTDHHAESSCYDDIDAGRVEIECDQSKESHRSRRRVGGRFASTGSSGSSKRSRTDDSENWIVTGSVPGGPVDGTVIPSFLGHVAYKMWGGEMRGILKLQTRSIICKELITWYNELEPQGKKMIDDTGLSHLPSTMYGTVDEALICAFVERWQPDTNSFHMPFGEMTIMLHDVKQILGIPVEGKMVSDVPQTAKLQSMCVELLRVTVGELTTNKFWQSGGVKTASIFEKCRHESRSQMDQAIAWVWVMLGSTLFVDKSGDRLRPSCLSDVIQGLEGLETFSWGSAALAYLYRQLGVASRADSKGVTGCLTLLQAWIYEYFPIFRPHPMRIKLPVATPLARTWSVTKWEKPVTRLENFRRQLDQLTTSDVTWLPYGDDPVSLVPRTIFTGWVRYRDIIEPYMPARVLRQFGYVQSIPITITRPGKVVRAADPNKYGYKVDHPDQNSIDAWVQFPDCYSLNLFRYQPARSDSGSCVDGYMEWYKQHSHPFVLRDAQLDEPVIPSRSNSEHWVNRLSKAYSLLLKKYKALDKDGAAEDGEWFEQFQAEWKAAAR